MTCATPGELLESVMVAAQWDVASIVHVPGLIDPKSVAKVTTAPIAAVLSLVSVTVASSVTLVEPGSPTTVALGSSVTLTPAPGAYALKWCSCAEIVCADVSTVDTSATGPATGSR